jgi:hypothetical protein
MATPTSDPSAKPPGGAHGTYITAAQLYSRIEEIQEEIQALEGNLRPTGAGLGKSQEASAGPKLTDWAQTSAAALAILGVGLYGAIRFGQQIFCNALGVRPEEVGLTYAASVSRAAVVIIALVSIILFYISGSLLWIVISAYLYDRGWIVRVVLLIVSGALGIGMTIVGLYVASLMGDAAELTALILLGLGGIAFIAPGVWHFCRWLWRKWRQPNRLTGELRVTNPEGPEGVGQPGAETPLQTPVANDKDRKAIRVLVVAFVLCLLVFGSFALSGTSATRAAERVRSGQAVGLAGGFGALGLRAEHVLVTGTPAVELELSNRDLMYLGQADGSTVVYDVNDDKALRLPSDSVSVVHKKAMITWEGSLSKDEALDFDENVSFGYDPDQKLSGVALGEAELGWSGDVIEVLPKHAGEVRAALLSQGAAHTRENCVQASKFFDQLQVGKQVKEDLSFCLHSSEGRWSLIQLTEVSLDKGIIEFRANEWPQ